MNVTKVDFHAWRFREEALGFLENALGAVFSDAPGKPRLTTRASGWKGYTQSAAISIDDMDVGLVAWGGEHQAGWAYASLSGRGCEWVADWDRAQEVLERLLNYSAKRTDIALDTFDPALGFDSALQAYRAGGFAQPGTGGRPPKCEPMQPEREEDSAIIRIGNRERDKYYRGYEKGKQLHGVECKRAMDAGTCFRIPLLLDGQVMLMPAADWFRHELELKPKTAPLPADLIDRRDEYFAGAYPYLGKVLKDVEPQILVMRRERGPQLELAAALAHIRHQFGNTLFTALAAYEGDIGAVWDKVIGTRHNHSLLQAGVMLVGHE
jgi:DNA relaxase NicK